MRNRMVLVVSANHRLEPFRGALRLLVQAPAQCLPNLLQLGCHSLADRLPVQLEVPRRAILPTDVCETQKVKGALRRNVWNPAPIDSCPAISWRQRDSDSL